MREKKFGNYRIRALPDKAPEVSYDDGKTWQEIDFSEAINEIYHEMNGIVEPAKTKKILFSEIQSPLSWSKK